MFKGSKEIMLNTKKPLKDVIKAIEDNSSYIGNVNASKSGNISTNAARFQGFGYSPAISGFVTDKGEGKYFISITHSANFDAIAWVIAICAFPIGMLAFLPAYNANQSMSLKIDQVLNEVKHAIE